MLFRSYWIDNNGGEDPPDTTLYPTFDSKGKDQSPPGHDLEDYFCFYSTDNFNLPFTAEHIKIELLNQPVGTDGDISLYKGLTECLANNAIASVVVVGGGDEKLDWQETGGGDTATYYVRVQNYSSQPNCGKPYTLKIQGLK